MQKNMQFLLTAAFLGLATAAVADGSIQRASEDQQSSEDKPLLSVEQTRDAIAHNFLNCQTDDVVGSRISTLTVCELAKKPMPMASHYRFLLAKDGLHPMFCDAGAGCVLPASVQQSLSSLTEFQLSNFEPAGW